ncbi:MAG: Kae1-associated kinase Bud32 [Nitrososphaerota archaeon]
MLRLGEPTAIIRLGAEATIYALNWNGMELIAKRRVPKSYRHPLLDKEIRMQRTVSEARIISEAKKYGVACPVIILVDLEDATIYMQRIRGIEARDIIGNLNQEDLSKLARRVGVLTGMLHNGGIAHGDLTLSNVIVDEQMNPYLVDFGLATFTKDIEEFAVDIHLLDRSLQSTHYNVKDGFMQCFLEGYRTVMGDMLNDVLKKVKDIESRGRYVEREMRKR